MSYDVSQPLLDYPVEAEGDIVSNPVADVLMAEHDLYVFPSLKRLAFGFYCLDKSQVIEDGRMELARDPVDIF